MSDLRNDAARLSLLHAIGAVTSEEVVHWADGMIVATDKPSHELIELSISPQRNVGDALQSIAAGADVWRPLEEALPKILEFVTANPDRAPIAARAFYHIAVSERYQAPEHLRFILNAEDNFDMANEGILRLDDIYRDFIDDLKSAISETKPA